MLQAVQDSDDTHTKTSSPILFSSSHQIKHRDLLDFSGISAGVNIKKQEER